MTTSDERERHAGNDTGRPAQRIEEDHRTIRDQLDIVAAAATGPDLLAALLALPRTLREHFEHEEHEEGLYEDLQRRQPSVTPKLETLRHEHKVILDDIDALVERLKEHVGTEQTGNEIAEPIVRGVTRSLERLRNHERAESRLISAIYYTDEGGFG